MGTCGSREKSWIIKTNAKVKRLSDLIGVPLLDTPRASKPVQSLSLAACGPNKEASLLILAFSAREFIQKNPNLCWHISIEDQGSNGVTGVLRGWPFFFREA